MKGAVGLIYSSSNEIKEGCQEKKCLLFIPNGMSVTHTVQPGVECLDSTHHDDLQWM